MSQSMAITQDQMPDAGQAAPLISVVVPVRNERNFIAATLEQILRQDYPAERFEVIVADGQSTDGTREVVAEMQRRHRNLRLVENVGRVSAAGRNAGLSVAVGQYVVIIDGHCQLDDRQYLRNVVDAFDRSGADCLGRPQPQDVPGASSLGLAIAAARSSWLGHHADSYIYSDQERYVPAQSVAVAYRRTVFDRVGLFDEAFDACEDVELNHRIDRAGMRCFFTPSIQVRYFPRASLRQLFRQLIRYGRGRVRLMRKHRDTFSLHSLLPAAFVLGTLGGLSSIWLSPALWLAYVICLAIYMVVLLTVSAGIAMGRQSVKIFGWLPLVFLTIHFGAGTGLVLEALRIAAPD